MDCYAGDFIHIAALWLGRWPGAPARASDTFHRPERVIEGVGEG